MRKTLTVSVLGCLHGGHFNLFEKVKALRDYLIVAVQDGYSAEGRKSLISALHVVGEVIFLKNVDAAVRRAVFGMFAISDDQRHEGSQRVVFWRETNGAFVVRMPLKEGICFSDIKSQIKMPAELRSIGFLARYRYAERRRSCLVESYFVSMAGW